MRLSALILLRELTYVYDTQPHKVTLIRSVTDILQFSFHNPLEASELLSLLRRALSD